MKTLKELLKAIENEKARSAWAKGVKQYAEELISEQIEYHGENHEFYASPADKKDLLNGAGDWSQYSWGGSALIYDCGIAERLCSPSELKKCKGGERNPNSREQWLDTQARALYQAERLICRLARA